MGALVMANCLSQAFSLSQDAVCVCVYQQWSQATVHFTSVPPPVLLPLRLAVAAAAAERVLLESLEHCFFVCVTFIISHF